MTYTPTDTHHDAYSPDLDADLDTDGAVGDEHDQEHEQEDGGANPWASPTPGGLAWTPARDRLTHHSVVAPTPQPETQPETQPGIQSGTGVEVSTDVDTPATPTIEPPAPQPEAVPVAGPAPVIPVIPVTPVIPATAPSTPAVTPVSPVSPGAQPQTVQAPHTETDTHTETEVDVEVEDGYVPAYADTPQTPTPQAPTVPVSVTQTGLLPDGPTQEAFTTFADITGDDFTEPTDTDDTTDTTGQTLTTASRNANTPTNRVGGLQITDRDRLILAFLARYRYAIYPQITAALGISYETARRRMSKMAKAGLVDKHISHRNTAVLWLPTRQGIAIAGLDLPAPEINLGSLAHTLGLVDLGVMYETRHPDFTVITEREIRAADTRNATDRMRAAYATHGIHVPGPDGHTPGHAELDASGFTPEERAKAERTGPLYCVRINDHTGKASIHVPDMVLVKDPNPDGTPNSIAVELELSHKPAHRWEQVLTAYKHADNIAGVIYWTHKANIANNIRTLAHKHGIAHMIQIKKFTQTEATTFIPLPE